MKREYVHPAFTSFLGAGTYVGGVREMVCANRGNVSMISQTKNITYAMCVKIESWIYHIYRGGDHEKRVEVSSA